MNGSRQTLAGSFRPSVGTALDPVPADESIAVTLVLRRRGDGVPTPHQVVAEPAAQGGPLTSAELGERFGAAPAELDRVTAYLAAQGLRVTDAHGPSRRLRVEGPAGTLAAVFGTSLSRVRRDDGHPQTRMRSGELSLPEDLTGAVTAVLGLDDRPQAFPRSIVLDPAESGTAAAAGSSFTPLQLATAYAMPPADGAGQTVAIIELGGGFGQADLDHYFTGLGLATPTVTAVGVDGAKNVAGADPQGADGEVLLDVEVVGAIAPQAHVVVYFAPNTDAGFVDAIATAAHATPPPAAISISWGQSEDQWTAQSRTAMDDAIADAVALGVTVTAAAGDNGSTDAASGSGSGSGAHADFPASSPHALGCGGTRLSLSGASVEETVWNDGGQGGATGGGVSDVFPVPAWQSAVGVPDRAGAGKSGRGVPDVAAVADPQTGYQVYVDGQALVIGGTSAVAPLWAGLVARLVQLGGKPLGLLQPAFYAGAAAGAPSPALRDITAGTNGAYRAAPGWDACTGLGVPSAATAAALGVRPPA